MAGHFRIRITERVHRRVFMSCTIIHSVSFPSRRFLREVLSASTADSNTSTAKMADIFRDSAFGQILRLFFNREMAPFEDEKPGFYPERSFQKEEQDDDKASIVSTPFGSTIFSKGSRSDFGKYESTVHTASISEKTKANEDLKLVDWIGPEDQDNPQNWSSLKKHFVFFQICLLTFTSKLCANPASNGKS